jgi:soluble lytic murein transglycosylase
MYRWIKPLRAAALVAPSAILLAVCAPGSGLRSPASAPDAGAGEPADAAASPAGSPAAAPGVTGGGSPAASSAPPFTSTLRLPDAAGRARGTEELRRAVALRRPEDAGAAAAAFDRAAEGIPALADWSHLLAAEALARSGDTAAVRQRLERAEPYRAREWGWRAREAAFLAAGDRGGAARALESAADDVADAARRAEIHRRLGELRVQRGERAAAVVAFSGAMLAAPGSRAARESAAAMAELHRGPAERLLEGRVWLRHGNVDRGTAGIEAFLAGGEATGAERAEVRLELGRALFGARRYRDAETHLLRAAREPQAAGAVAAEALFLAGRSQFRDGRTDAARTTFLSVGERYPTEQAAAQAYFILGDLDQDAGRTGAAREHFRRAAAANPQAGDAALAVVRHAGALMLAGDAAGAASLIDAFIDRRTADRHSAQLHFWSARAHERAGNASVARQRYDAARQADPVSYYGTLAAGRLGSAFRDLPLRSSPVDDPVSRAAVDVGLLRSDVLSEAGLSEVATLEMEILRTELQGATAALYLLAEAHHARGAPAAGILLGREIQRREGAWNTRLLKIVFPFPHRALIEAESRRHGLDPFIVAGLIRQESMFNTNAVSPAGAIGLMQVMPGTGRMLARRAGVSSFNPDMLRRPELNVRLGTLFLADLLGRSNNRTEAFAGYNAGPTRAARWRQYPEFRDEELFAERIPFVETRDYVKILAFNAGIYRMLYGE